MPPQRVSNLWNRNVRFVNAANDEIGGFYQNGSVTWAEMLEWMQIVFELPFDQYAPFRCLEVGDPNEPLNKHDARINMQGNEDRVQPGFYILLSPEGLPVDIPINPENPIPRSLSRSLSNLDLCNEDFRRRVRERDQRCVITKEQEPDFTGLIAAHIFPVAYLDLWKSGLWQHHISDDKYVGATGLHSVQNGILLDSTVHTFFDKYKLAINPDNDYKVVCFVDRLRFDGMKMYRNLDIALEYQPSRALLKHHFRMAVLHNMKAMAEYLDWDEDMPEGTDPIREVASSKMGKYRLEIILAERLNGMLA